MKLKVLTNTNVKCKLRHHQSWPSYFNEGAWCWKDLKSPTNKRHHWWCIKSHPRYVFCKRCIFRIKMWGKNGHCYLITCNKYNNSYKRDKVYKVPESLHEYIYSCSFRLSITVLSFLRMAAGNLGANGVAGSQPSDRETRSTSPTPGVIKVVQTITDSKYDEFEVKFSCFSALTSPLIFI